MAKPGYDFQAPWVLQCLLADASEKVPKIKATLIINYQRRIGIDWRSFMRFSECVYFTIIRFSCLTNIFFLLQEPSNVQQTFSSERTPTIWRIIPSLEFLIKRWESMAIQPRYCDVKTAIDEGIQSLKSGIAKWIIRRPHILSALVCSHTSETPNRFLSTCSLRSKCQGSVLSSPVGT